MERVVTNCNPSKSNTLRSLICLYCIRFPLRQELETEGRQEDNHGNLRVCEFSQAPSKDLAEEWQAWLSRWADTVGDPQEVCPRLRAVNPKYVPREWMLAEAYDKVGKKQEKRKNMKNKV